MKDLKIIYVLDIDKRLSYPIYKLIKLQNGYYKIFNYDKNDSLENCFYTITEENKIIENIYKDKVFIFNQVLENLYLPNEDNNKKEKKLRIHSS